MQLTRRTRIAWLEAKATAAAVGVFPVVVGMLFVLAAIVQEPSIFRTEGLELAWPGISAASDVLFLVVIWNSFMLPLRRNDGWFARGLGVWAVGALVSVLLVLAAWIYDATVSHAFAPDRSRDLLFRIAIVWLPICLLGNSPALRRLPTLARAAAVVVAYLMQASVVPASLPAVGVGELLTFSMGPVLVAVALSSTNSREPDLPLSLDADRNPR